ncbi:MAG TPA: PIN domain-containing protein [Opitutaceae bacterium]|jgi:tRNA(fMet)-specific endonuclease VapC|nr:PIN domain-containing protein [Opitutaceae bacterium]
MGLILDTSVLIAAERQQLDLRRLFEAHADESFFIAAITAAELLHGVERAQPPARKKIRLRHVEAVLSEIEAIDFDLSVARRHARLWAGLEKTGEVIGAYDLLIAATALHYDHAVVTLNPSEFRHVAGLRIIDPTPFRLP